MPSPLSSSPNTHAHTRKSESTVALPALAVCILQGTFHGLGLLQLLLFCTYPLCPSLPPLHPFLTLSVPTPLPSSLPPWPCLCLCLSLSVCLSVCLAAFLPTCLSICLAINQSINLSVCLLYLSACLSVYLSVWVYVCVCVCVCMCVRMSVCLLSVCLPACLSSICLGICRAFDGERRMAPVLPGRSRGVVQQGIGCFRAWLVSAGHATATGTCISCSRCSVSDRSDILPRTGREGKQKVPRGRNAAGVDRGVFLQQQAWMFIGGNQAPQQNRWWNKEIWLCCTVAVALANKPMTSIPSRAF